MKQWEVNSCKLRCATLTWSRASGIPVCLPEGFDMQHIFWCATAAAVSFLIESTIIIIYGNGHRGRCTYRRSAKFPQLCQSPQPHSHSRFVCFSVSLPIAGMDSSGCHIRKAPNIHLSTESGGILLGHERARTSGQQRIPKSSGQTAMVRIGRVQ